MVGERIRALRVERRGPPITQGEIARLAGISVSFLSMIERGERSASIETLSQIAEALGATTAELFTPEGGRPQMTPAFQQLASFLQRRRVGRRQLVQLLEVAKAMFSD
jgi:transcriptional regulator with XRE-family HTH domain